MATVGSLAYSIVANTQQFTSGIVASKQELRTLKEAFLQSQSPTDIYSKAIDHLTGLIQKFPDKADPMRRVIAQINEEMNKAAAAQGAWLAGVKAKSIQLEHGAKLERVSWLERVKANSAILEQSDRLRFLKENTDAANESKKKIVSTLGRMGIVLDPVSAGFQAFNLAVGVARTALDAFERVARAVGEEMTRLDELAKKSATLGIDASSLVGLRRAAEDLSGVAGDAFDQAFTIFTRRIGEAAMTGTGDAAKALERLSLNGTDLSAMAPDDAFLKVAEAISKVQNPTERLTLAYQLLGRQGGELATTLAAGPAAIQGLIDRQQELSQIEFIDLQSIQEANDAMAELETLAQGVVSLLASEQSTLIKDISGDLTKASEHGEDLRKVMQGVAIATAIITDNVESMIGFMSSSSVQSFWNGFESTNPVLIALDKLATINAGGVMGDAGSRTRGVVQNQIENRLNPAAGETARTAIENTEAAKKSQEDADKAADARYKRDFERQGELADLEEKARKAEEKADDERFKRDFDRQGELADLEQRHADKLEQLSASLDSPAEKLKRDMEELLALRSEGMDDELFNKALTDLQMKARDLADQEGIRPQTIGAVRAGSVEALRSQFGGRNVSEKQLEEQRKAVAEAATASGLLSEIKGLLATNTIKEAL